MYGDVYKQHKLSQNFCTVRRTRTHLLEPQEKEEETQKKIKIGLGRPKVAIQGHIWETLYLLTDTDRKKW